MMQKILISSCLLGEQVKYNGGDNLIQSTLLEKWQDEERLVIVCPEMAGGLPVPRNPVEIQQGEGADVLLGKSIALDTNNKDVTDYFIRGAYAALELAKKNDISIAILKERSPSCGSNMIYTGDFSGKLKEGKGVTARLLEQNGIRVFSEDQLEAVDNILDQS